MTNKLVVIINSLKVPKIKKILLYEMKFLVPNYGCLQNPWLGGYRSQVSVPSAHWPELNLLNLSRTKFLGTPLLTMCLIHILKPRNPASLSVLFNVAVNLRLCSAFDGWMNEYGALVGVLWEKFAPLPLCPSQVQHGTVWSRTETSAMRDRRQTFWIMAWPLTFVLVFAKEMTP